MKKTLVLIALILFPSLVFARGYHHHRSSPPPVSTPTSTVPTPPVVQTPPPVTIPSAPISTQPNPISVQFGMYNNSKQTPYGTITGFFIGDGDSFSQDVASLKISGPLFVYWESSLTALQIESGAADSYLKSWASDMKAYGQVDFAPLDEMNGNWSPYYGQSGTFQAAWIHIHSLFAGSNVKFFYDANVCGPGMPCSDLTAYYPGSAYVDAVGLDGFSFASQAQTWGQVFNASIPTMQSFGKPLWITSEGVANNQNQSQFVSDSFAAAKTDGFNGIIYFNAPGSGGTFTLGSAGISTLQANL